MIGNTVKDGKDRGNILRLEAGEINDTDDDLNDGKLRRRRRRGGGARNVR